MLKKSFFSRINALVFGLFFMISMVSLQVIAADVDENKLSSYQVISEQEWVLAPGITESEIVLNNTAGNKQQVTHVVEIDVTNPYTKVIPSYYKMAEGLSGDEYKTQIMSEQAKYAEENGYGNVVVAMNTCLHWYDTDYYAQHPELIGEPLGTLILDGELYRNSQNSYFGAYTCIVINFDEKDGQPRPDNIPKVQVRQTYDAITGWEEQLIPASFHFLVKNGVNQHSVNDPEPFAPRSMMGVKADGTLVLVMVEGRQAPYSTGFNAYEMAEYMISLGCIQAINCDGGGSSTFLSQRPGEELELHCYPSDGKERPVTQGVLVISTAHICEWENETITKPATCTENGEKMYTCQCGETITEEIVAPGHVDENANTSCDICGETVAVKNGVVFDSDGNVRYYVNGVATRAGLVRDSRGNYYYINSTLKAVKNCTYAFSTAMGNGLLPGGTYQFAADGKMIDPPAGKPFHMHAWGEGTIVSASCTEAGNKLYICDCGLSKTETVEKLGHIDENENFACDRCNAAIAHTCVWGDGVVATPASCTEDGVKTYTCKCGKTKTEVIEASGHIDENEDFACDRCNAAIAHTCVWGDGVVTTPASCTNGVKTYTCGCGETKTEVIPAIGSHIDENGDLTCDVCSGKLNAKTGIVFEKNGDIRYYENGVAIISKGLVQDSRGNYYYINSTGKAVKNCSYAFSAARSNGLLPAGTYQFAADGKMINPPVEEPPHVHVWGEGVVTTPATCTEEGVKTFTCECNETRTEVVAALGHTDEIADGICDRCGADLGHEHVWGDGIVTTPATCIDGVKTYTCGCGETKTEVIPAISSHIDENGDLSCDRCSGKLSTKTGLVFEKNGDIRYYENGVAIISKGLVQDSQGNYYYINSTGKAVKNCKYAFSAARSNGLLPAGTYQFAADGKLILN